MVKQGLFRRRRPNTSTGETSGQSVRPEGRVVSSPNNERLPALQEEAPDLRRVSRYSSVRSTFDSTTSASDLKATEKAFVVSRALSRNWMGVEDEEEDLTVSRVHPSASPFFRQWIEQQQHLQSPQASIRERSPPAASAQEASSVASTQVVLWKSWKFAITLLLIGICLSGVLWSGVFSNLVSGFQFFGGLKLHSSKSELPFRDRYFKVLIHDDNTGRFGSNFEKGLMDAAQTLRVNVSIQRSQDIKETVLNIEEASCSFFDGLLVTLTGNPALRRGLQDSKHRTSIITTGALESYSTELGDDDVGHLGEQETTVGRLAAEKMKEAGMKTSVCLSRADNVASVHRCRGFKQAFGTQTYELNLNTMLQSELKSKLIPTILDDSEINGLFIADPRSFALVHQILRSLHRLCSNKKAASSGRCIYFGTFGTDFRILQAVQKREIQFTIDPQEYLHGYLASTWMMLASNGFPIPTSNENSAFQFSRVIDSSEQAKIAMMMPKRVPSTSRFQSILFGDAPPKYLQELKKGLRNAARDFNVHVEFRHCISGLESQGCAVNTKDNHTGSNRLFDGYAFSTFEFFDNHVSHHFESIVRSGKPYLTFGEHHSFYNSPSSTLHIGYHQMEGPTQNEPVLDKSHDPALHGYLSVLFLTLNNRFGEIPYGFLNTSNKYTTNLIFDP